jgi:TatD DNase family protein
MLRRVSERTRTYCHSLGDRLMQLFYDTHAHLDDPDLAPDLPLILERALAAGVTRVISIGTDLESSRRAVSLADQHEQVYAVVGWHPANAHEAPDDLRPVLRSLACHSKVVALGETGFDYHWLPSRSGVSAEPAEDRLHQQRQAQVFQQHLEVAIETGLNLVIHQRGRGAFDHTLEYLRPFAGRVGAVFHCFGEATENLSRVLELGFLVSFTGIVTFKNAQTVRESVAAVPIGSFLLETDSPSLAPVPYRGHRCEPSHVKEIAELVAQVKGCPLREISTATCEAAHRFFPRLLL